MKYSITDIKSVIPEIQTGLHWYITFLTSPSVVAIPDTMAMRATEAEVPKTMHEPVKVNISGHTIHYIGKVSRAGEVTIKLQESMNNEVNLLLYTWYEATWTNGQGVQNITPDLKCDMEIILCSPDDKITRKYKLEGCLLDFTSNISLDQEANAETVTLKVTYDNYDITEIGG